MARGHKKEKRITRLRLSNWCNFKNVDVQLEKRVFLVGPNASGKSNFLDAFRFLRDIVSFGGGLQEAVSKRGDIKSIRSLSARTVSNVEIEVCLGNEDNLEQWRYSLSINNVKSMGAVIRRELVENDGAVVLSRPDRKDKSDPERLTQTYLQQVNANQHFREIASFFKSIKYLHIVPQLIREPERSVGKVHDPFGGDFLEQIASTSEKTQKARLHKIEKALMVAVPQLQQIELQRDSKGTPHLRGKYEHWRPRGAWQSESQFSDGTLRLIGLLWSILEGSGPLLLEEPELSLHPEIIRYLPQMFFRMQRLSGRQVMISSHSNVLLEDEGIGLDEVLLLDPGPEGTTITSTATLEDIRGLVHGGMSIGDALIPRSSPKNAQQLTFFGD